VNRGERSPRDAGPGKGGGKAARPPRKEGDPKKGKHVEKVTLKWGAKRKQVLSLQVRGGKENRSRKQNE